MHTTKPCLTLAIAVNIIIFPIGGKIIACPDFGKVRIPKNVITQGECDLRWVTNSERKDLIGLDLSGANLQGVELSGFDLTGTNLSHSNISNTTLYGAILFETNLSGAFMYQTEFFRTSKLIRVNFSNANLEGSAFITTSSSSEMDDLSDIRMSTNNFSHVNMTGFINSKVSFQETKLSQIILDEASFYESDLRQVDFSESSLRNTDLGNSDLRSANFNNADLTGANLFMSMAKNANFEGAILAQSHLGDSNLSGANLSDADLTGANLTDSDLRGANLSNISYNSETNFRSAMYNWRTRFPDDFSPQARHMYRGNFLARLMRWVRVT